MTILMTLLTTPILISIVRSEGMTFLNGLAVGKYPFTSLKPVIDLGKVSKSVNHKKMKTFGTTNVIRRFAS